MATSSNANWPSLEESRRIAEAVYIFGLPIVMKRRAISHLRGQVACHFHAHADPTKFGCRPYHRVVPSSGLRPSKGRTAS